MRNIKHIFFGLLVVISACTTAVEERQVVAQVYDYKLYLEDVVSQIPKGISADDSLLLMHEFINQWTHQQAILHKANINDQHNSETDEAIAKQVEDYRNSLLVYGYTKRLIEQRLDTIVNYDEIESYYDDHKNDFTLKDDIVQVAYVKFSTDAKNLKQVRKLLQDFQEDDVVRLRSIAEDKAVNFFLDENTWILFDDLLHEIPIETYNRELYLRNNKYVEVSDSLYTYMLRINNYRIQDNFSPLSFEYDRIRSIIINMRKMELIERMKKDVFEEAQQKGAIKIAI